jgi:hypothetical protein
MDIIKMRVPLNVSFAPTDVHCVKNWLVSAFVAVKIESIRAFAIAIKDILPMGMHVPNVVQSVYHV